MIDLPLRVLKDNDVVPFVATHPRYGRAEFAVCLKYVRGKLKHVFIHPQQQENVTEYYRLDVPHNGRAMFQAHSWTHKGVSEPKIWLHFWCREHECPAFRLYVPKEAKSFVASIMTDISMIFDA